MTTQNAEEHIIYYVPGELVLTLVPNVQTDAAQDDGPLDGETLDALETLFRETLRIPLYPEPWSSLDGAIRPPVRLGLPAHAGASTAAGGVGGGPASVLLVVNLRSWTRWPEEAPPENDVRQGIEDVPIAVERVHAAIGRSAGIPVGDYLLTEAGPNWLVHTLECCTCDCPAGTPVAYMGNKSFQIPDVSQAVNTFLAAAYQAAGTTAGTTARPASVTVSIFDTWSADPANPGRLYQPKWLASPVHDTYVPKSFAPGRGAGHTHGFNPATGKFEPDYHQSDHGLFVAGIVHQIAPQATIEVYRVLNDDGLGQFSFLQQAFNDARSAAAPGSAQIFNLSLGIGPNPLVLEDYLTYPTMALQPNTVVSTPPGVTWVHALQTAFEQYRTESRTARLTTILALLANSSVQTNIQQVVNAINANVAANILTIAAAGNDSDRSQGYLAAAQLPAILSGVVGVAAAPAPNVVPGGSGQPADYSDDNLNQNGNSGTLAFGGAVLAHGAVPQSDPADSPVSEYITDEFFDGVSQSYDRPRPPATEACWSGTSFAAALVSGLAAAAWAASGTAGAAGSPMLTAQQFTDGLQGQVIDLVQG